MKPANEGVGFLVGRLVEDATDEPRRATAARVVAASVAAGWLSWQDVAAELDGLTEELDGMTAQAARERYGSALGDVDEGALLAALGAVDAEATEPRCSVCRRPVGVVHGQVGWSHFESIEDPVFGWRRQWIADAGHAAGGPVWRYGHAAVPVDQVGSEPAGEDFDAVDGRDRILMAGAALLGVVHDVDFHYHADGGWADPWGADTADATRQIRWVAEQLERAAAAARVEVDAVERIARVRAAHRRRSADRETGSGPDGGR